MNATNKKNIDCPLSLIPETTTVAMAAHTHI